MPNDPLIGAVVLVVDDTEAQRYSIARHLSLAGCRVVECATGTDGLAQAHSGVDLIVLDVNLPDISGFEVARALKANERTAHVPILHLSAARTTAADRVAGLDGGADGYLAHPLDPEEFVSTVRSLLRLAVVERALRQRTEAAEHAFAALTASEELFRHVQDTSLHGFGLHRPVCAPDGTGGIVDFEITYVNPAGARLVGLSPAELQGRRMLEAFPELVDAGLFDGYVRVAETGEPYLRTYLEPGGRVPLALEVSAVRVGVGATMQLAVTFTDIGARVRSDGELTRLHAAAQGARVDAEAARAAADEANQEKTDFLTHMSHELRTPLNAIGGYTQLLELGVHGPVTADQQATLTRIGGAHRHMLGLVNGVLDFASLHAGRVEYDIEDTDVLEVLSEVLSMVEPQRAAKGLLIDVCIPTEPTPGLRVLADRSKLVQLLLNVVANAVKFTPAGGCIRIERGMRAGGSAPQGVVFLRVADTGIGIPPDRLDAIFEPFVQAHRAAPRASGHMKGTGLGLAISRGLARGMGGELRARSTAGSGSAFTVTLPVAWHAGDSDERRDGEERRVEPDRRG